MIRESLSIGFVAAMLTSIGCTPAPDDNPFSSFNPTLTSTLTYTTGSSDTDTEEGESGMADGDMPGDSGDGDGDTGDGDGDTGDGDSGDGDGDTTGDGDGDPGCDWMPNPDQNPNAQCDPILQDCPMGQKCVAYESVSSWDNNKCVPVSGNKVPGQACIAEDIVSGIDNCNADGQCFNLDVDGNGTCLAFCGCTYENPECSVGTNCLVANQGSLALCVDQCDPLLQDCGPGQGCYPSGDTLLCAAQTENLGPGETCGYINDCEPGSACYNLADACGGPCCTPFCDVNGNDSECAVLPGTTCQAVSTWGVCG